jgi:hypothetical protein
MKIDRRTFLVGVGGTLAAGAAAERTTAWARRRAVGQWVERLSVSASARDLGTEYLTRHPDEGDRSILLGRLAGLVPPLALLGNGERTPGGFNEQVRRDFLDGDIVRMGGWLLSRTELRLCALVALDRDQELGVHGVFAPQELENGDTLYWTAPAARFTVPADTSLEFRLRSGAREPQRVTVRIDGVVVGELPVWGREWQRTRYVVRPARGSALQIDLATAPEWKPGNDFRTMGVGIDRIWA